MFELNSYTEVAASARVASGTLPYRSDVLCGEEETATVSHGR